jgi:vacuolar-type H+-ATPase subunit I/STV1
MDILNKLGSKKETSGVDSSTTNQTGAASSDPALTANGSRGANLLDQVGTKTAEVTTSTVSNDSGPNTIKEEPSGAKGDSSWTVDSALKEVKKLREENKATRIQYAESLDKLKVETDQRLSAREKELEKFIGAQQELEELKQKEADKKRDVSEKLANREAVLAEIKAKAEAAERQWQEKLSTMQNQLHRYEADAVAQQQVYKSRLEEELKAVPEKFKGVATLLVKGAGDPRDALIALTEAKLQGVFEDKTVVVNHSVPGAHDGARATNERMDEAKRAAREKLTSSQKIKSALGEIRSGGSNTAFRIK